ncbi:MAG TPA: FHA domain-containing protein [Enhygromyxa sp.]|nr:FHA domain-containing protein [Enhygromyxa sp.]
MNKTVHQIECREDIWKRVEALAKRRGVSTDEIVQAALIQLFTRKKEASNDAKTPVPGAPPGPPPSARPSGPPTPSPAAGRATLPRPPGAPPGPPPPGPSRLPPPARASAPPPAPEPAEDLATEGDRPLYLFFEGNWYTIDQEQFVIGRGSKFSDLPIKDANISRRHCAVVRRNGDYFIKDLGSTNGVEFAGQRVDDHRVEEGNVYYLCDHELRFSFTAPY